MGREREITVAVTAQTFLFNAALEFGDAGWVGLYSWKDFFVNFQLNRSLVLWLFWIFTPDWYPCCNLGLSMRYVCFPRKYFCYFFTIIFITFVAIRTVYWKCAFFLNNLDGLFVTDQDDCVLTLFTWASAAEFDFFRLKNSVLMFMEQSSDYFWGWKGGKFVMRYRSSQDVEGIPSIVKVIIKRTCVFVGW